MAHTDEDTTTEATTNCPQTVTTDEEALRRGKRIPRRPHRDEPILRYLRVRQAMTYKEAAEKIEALFGYDCCKSMVSRGVDHHDIPDPTRDGPFADVFNDDDAEPAQPPSFLVDRSEGTPVHPFDTDLFSPNDSDGRWPPMRNETALITPQSPPSPESHTDAGTPDSPDSDSECGTDPLKPPRTDYPPSAYRVPKERRDESLVAPPWAVYSDDFPDAYKACGCQQCDEKHFLDGDSGSVDCEEPVPVTIAGARRIYQKTEGALWANDDRGNDVSRGKRKYAVLMKADSAALRRDGEDGVYYSGTAIRGDHSTALVSCRVTCTDGENRLITPYTLVQDVKDAWGEARDEIPDEGRIAYFWTVAGTDFWATPHIHLYAWYWDPDDQLTVEDFRPIVKSFCEHSGYAEWTVHFDGSGEDAPLYNGGAVRLEHETLLVDRERFGSKVSDKDGGKTGAFADILGDDDDVPDRLTEGDDVQSRGAVYVGSQLPYLALAGVETPAEAETAAFCKVARDGRNNAYGSRRFYELPDDLDAISEYESHPNVE